MQLSAGETTTNSSVAVGKTEGGQVDGLSGMRGLFDGLIAWGKSSRRRWRRAHAGLHESRQPRADLDERAGDLLEQKPPGAVAQGRDQRQ